MADLYKVSNDDGYKLISIENNNATLATHDSNGFSCETFSKLVPKKELIMDRKYREEKNKENYVITCNTSQSNPIQITIQATEKEFGLILDKLNRGIFDFIKINDVIVSTASVISIAKERV